MMRSFKRILVHVDVMASSHPALDRAVELARHVGADLKIVDVVPEFSRRARLSLSKDLQTRLTDQRAEQIQAIASSLDKGAGPSPAISTEVLTGRPAIEVVRDVLRHGHDVLLKSHGSPSGRARGPLFDALDMQLLRKCPCPVWLVGPDPPHRGRVLAAIDPNPEDPVEQALNLRILELALYLTEAEYRELVILHAWHAFGQELLRPLASEDDVKTYVEAARDVATRDMEECLAPLSARLGQASVRLEPGEPGTLIPQFVAAEQIDLVVMGSVARTGITGLVMGNTAERILSSLTCSVLTVKPDGFVCPVTLDA